MTYDSHGKGMSTGKGGSTYGSKRTHGSSSHASKAPMGGPKLDGTVAKTGGGSKSGSFGLDKSVMNAGGKNKAL